MKEATGELNMTVVTVVAIAAVAAFFYAFVWPAVKANINRNTYCASAFACEADGNNCHYIDETGTEQTGLNCSGSRSDANNTFNNNAGGGQAAS